MSYTEKVTSGRTDVGGITTHGRHSRQWSVEGHSIGASDAGCAMLLHLDRLVTQLAETKMQDDSTSQALHESEVPFCRCPRETRELVAEQELERALYKSNDTLMYMCS